MLLHAHLALLKNDTNYKFDFTEVVCNIVCTYMELPSQGTLVIDQYDFRGQRLT